MLTPNMNPRTRTGGFTLVELLIAMVLMGIIGGAIVTLLLRQQRFYNSANELINTRQQIRQAAAMLPADLRGISSVGGDIYVMTDSSIDFRSVFGSSFACAVDGKGSWVSTVPVSLVRQSAMTNWSGIPTQYDSIALYNDGPTTAQNDDAWTVHQITAVPGAKTGGASNGCPTSSGLVTAAAADLALTNPSYQLTLSPTFNNVSVGAAIRFFRRVHYSLYKSATDNLWYLGYQTCKPVTGCTAIQPIGGPFQPFATDGTSGLQFTYYDSTGAVTVNRAQVARISLAVRGQGTSLVAFSGTKAATTFRDSLRMEINLRNRK